MSEAERPCLHCYLKDGISEYWKNFGEQAEDGAPIVDLNETLTAFAQVQAEFILKIQSSAMQETIINDVKRLIDAAVHSYRTGEPVGITLGEFATAH